MNNNSQLQLRNRKDDDVGNWFCDDFDTCGRPQDIDFGSDEHPAAQYAARQKQKEEESLPFKSPNAALPYHMNRHSPLGSSSGSSSRSHAHEVPHDAIPCTARTPVIGDRVAFRRRGVLTASDSDGNDWSLSDREVAKVFEVGDEGDFKLVNPSGRRSAWIFRMYFVYEPVLPPMFQPSTLPYEASIAPRRRLSIQPPPGEDERFKHKKNRDGRTCGCEFNDFCGDDDVDDPYVF